MAEKSPSTPIASSVQTKKKCPLEWPRLLAIGYFIARPFVSRRFDSTRSARPALAAHDRRTDEVIAAIQKTGEAFFGGTTWRGRRAMRASDFTS